MCVEDSVLMETSATSLDKITQKYLISAKGDN